MAETTSASVSSPTAGDSNWRENKLWKGTFAVAGIMLTLVTYGVLQEKIMRVPYGVNKDYFKYSLFLVFCNRITTSAVSAGALLASKKALDPVAPIYKYCLVSVSNILTTSCQYEALKYVSFPVQTLAKCAKMIPVMDEIHVTTILSAEDPNNSSSEDHGGIHTTIATSSPESDKPPDGPLPIATTNGYKPAGNNPDAKTNGTDNQVSLPLMEAPNGNVVDTLSLRRTDQTCMEEESSIVQLRCSAGGRETHGVAGGVSQMVKVDLQQSQQPNMTVGWEGLIIQGHLLPAVEFVYIHKDCFFDIALLSTVATASQFFISYTIRTFGALTFATIMTTRQLVSILLSCVWFAHPLSWQQWIGAVIVFGAIYAKSFLRKAPEKTTSVEHVQNGNGNSNNLKENP
ncbi:hypothetical protein JHK87_030882 [Glycine soja]|nr:hypothetical protein JHK87_030882 [Glycine soja]